MLVLSQFLHASEKAEENNSPNMQIDACWIELDNKSTETISIQEALDLCALFVKKNKIDFNINASYVTARVKHSKNGVILKFSFIYKFRCLDITIDESKKVASWQISYIDM